MYRLSEQTADDLYFHKPAMIVPLNTQKKRRKDGNDPKDVCDMTAFKPARRSMFRRGSVASLPHVENQTNGDHRHRLPDHTSEVSRSKRTDSWAVHSDEHRLPWSKRLKHITWAYFTVTMATGGIANVLSAIPFRFYGLYTIGLIFFLVNIALYIFLWVLMLTRFYLYPHAFTESLTHPTESLFVPAFVVSFGTILITIVEYGTDHAGPWLAKTVLILFWTDCVVAVTLSLAIYMILWTSTSFTIDKMTPIWIFPAYPLLIIGPHAANLSARLPIGDHSLEVIIGGWTIQGIGFLVALTIYSAFVYRLMTHKLPAERTRPGMFVSVGPSAFTVSGTIGMARSLHQNIAGRESFMNVPGLLAAQILQLAANWMSLWLWGLSIWFFFVALISNIDCIRPKHHVPFAMTWFSFVFPQSALVTSTFAVAEAFGIRALQIVGCVMAVLLIIAWAWVVAMMIRAIWRHDILWPEKGEDKLEGGFHQKIMSRHERDFIARLSPGSHRFDTHLHLRSWTHESEQNRAMGRSHRSHHANEDLVRGAENANLTIVNTL